MYKFNANTSEKDHSDFVRFDNKVSPSKKKSRVSTTLVSGFFAVTALIVSTSPPGQIFWQFMGIVSAVFCVGQLFLWDKIYWHYTIKAIKTDTKNSSRPLYGNDFYVSFDEESICVVTELSEGKSKYATIDKIYDAGPGNAVYLYTGTSRAIIIPHRAFENEEQKDNFLTFIRGKVPNQ